ncbi:MAG: 16S rRNA endonuclease CdiA [Luteibacter sp.]|uniref:hemagglutinin repeat-containing protein n=1 Tax=Luteibacter sp. TaxID=1886636 RepID=UPI00137D93BA|nr:hemagglutinin repeat-containing protein [Luteibacter sp.]KAF1005598.1 MAG: 16S rRNA endonuclease CdiA [Luteibacter sp.]
MTTILPPTAATPKGLDSLRRATHTLAFALGVALVGAPIASQAQVAGAPGSAQAPHVDTSANGTPVVNIVAPTQGGVSHNQYEHFNVDPKGVVLNNSGSVSQSQLAGYIVGNTNLAPGQAARVIVNEVTSANPSNLRGFTEVAGNRAEVVIANPNGITCDGCGFINTTRGTLVTGTPVFGGDGSLAAFRVTRGTLAINGAGLNGAGIDRLDLIARTVVANAKVWANELNVVTGANQVNYADLATQAIQGEGAGSGVSLDVAALGGMYANKIRLLGTEAGVGVRNASELATQGGDFTITQAGRLELTGKTTSTGRLDAQAAAIANSGSFAAGTDLVARTTGAVDNSGTIYATGNATLASGALTNSGKLYAVGGALDVTATDIANRTGGDIYAGQSVRVRASSLDNAASLESGTTLDIATAGRLANSGTLIASGTSRLAGGDIANTGKLSLAGATNLVANGTLSNGGDIVSGGDIAARASRVDNRGQWQSGGITTIDAGTLANQGTLKAKGAMSLTVTDSVSQGGTLLSDGNVTVRTGRLDNRGQWQSGGDLAITTATLNNQGVLYAGRALTLDATGAVVNAGQLYANADATLRAGALTNSDLVRADGNLTATIAGDIVNTATMQAAQKLALDATGALTNSGKLYAIGGALVATAGRAFTSATTGDIYAKTGIDLRGGSVANQGTVEAGQGVAVHADGTLSNEGTMLADAGDTTLSGADVVQSGKASASNDVTLTATGTLDHRGTTVAGRDLSVSAADTTTAGHMQAGRDLNVDASSLRQQGVVYAKRDIALNGGDADNAKDATILADGALRLRQSGKVSNAGTMQGGTVLDAQGLASFDNTATGTVYAGDRLAMQATRIDNAGSLYATNGVDLKADHVGNTGSLRTGANLTINATDASNDGTAYASGNAVWNVATILANSGMLVAKGDLHLVAGSIVSTGTLGAGVLGDGSLGTTGLLDAVVTGALANHGSTLAAGNLRLSGTSLDLSSGRTRAGGDIALNATAGDIDASHGSVATAGVLGAHASGALKNANGTLQGGTLDIQATRLDNGHGTITQTGSSDLTLAVAGTLDNTAGRIASQSRQLTLRGGSVINDNGAIEHAGDGTLVVDGKTGISNRGGRIVGNGALDLDTQGALDSTGGTLSMAHGATIDAASFANDAGTLVASLLTITTGGQLSNNGGTLQSGGALQVNAGSFANGSGQVKVLTSDLARLAIAGAMTNGVGGFVGGNGGLWLHAGAIDNAGQLYGGSTADVASTARLDNRGAIQSMGSATIVANGTLANDSGRIESGSGDVHATLTLNAGALSNQGGRIANTGDGLTTINAGGTIANTNGTLGGQGDVTLNAGAIDNLSGGRLVAARHLTLAMGALNNSGGNVYAGGNLGWDNGGATLTNVNGQFGAGQRLAVTLAWLNNNGGNASANGDASFNLVGGLTGAGRIIAGNNLDIWLPGDFVNGSAGTLKANNRFGLHLGGNFYNADWATMESVGGLTIDAGRIENGNGACINSANTVLNSRGDVVNHGRIEGDNLAISGGCVENTGTLIGDTITVRAWDLTNGADFGGVADNAAYQSALIAATRKVSLLVGGTFLNRDALVFSMGDIFIAANEAAGRTVQITNHSGDIEADGSILLAANQITNQRRVFETDTYVLNAAEQLANRHTTDNIVRYRYDDPDPTHKPPYVDQSQIVDAAEIKWVEGHCYDLKSDNHRCRGYPYGKGSPDTFKAVYIDTLTSIQRLTRTSAEGRIAAGGDITLIGSVLNDKSTIAAARNLTVNGAGGSLPAGDSNVGGEVIRNIGWNPTGTLSRQVQWWTGWESISHQGGRHWVEDGFQKYADFTNDATLAIGDGQRPDWLTIDPGQGLSGRMTAGNALEIHGRTIDNTTVDAAGNPISGVGLGGNQGGTRVSGNGAGTVGAVGGSVDLGGVGGLGNAPGAGSVGGVDALSGDTRNAGPRPGSQSVGTPDAPAGQIRVPNNGLFTTRPGSGSAYLIETDPRFASQAGFLGSDYLMSRLGFNGESTMKRLGDGFYEQRMVLEQITSLTGRRFLTDNTDAMAQYRALMDAGADVAHGFQLSVGVALTAEQMSRLTQDIVWMVTQEVNGEKVLVPVVYLSAAHAQEVAQSGAIMSGKTVLLDASGNLTNTGSIKAGQDATLKAGTLLNGGNIGAGGNLSVTAAQDILNGGTLKGGNVSLTAGNDILSGAGIGRVDLGGIKLGDSLAPLDASRLGLVQGGSIAATGNLSANAGRNLTLDRAPISAGGDLSLTAKRDLSATASAIKAGGDAILGAGRDLVSEGAKVKAGDQIAISAGHDVVLNAVTDVERHSDAGREGRKIIDTRTMDQSLKGTELTGTKGVIVSAGHDIDATAVAISSEKGSVALAAKNDVNLNAGEEEHTWSQDTVKKSSGLFSSKKSRTHDATDDVLAVGSSIKSGDGVSIAAGNDVTLQGASVRADGALALAAGRDINLTATEDRYSETHESKTSRSGLVINRGAAPVHQGKTTKREETVEQTIGHGTSLSGDSVTAAAGRNLLGEGVQVAATHDVLLAAGNDLRLTAIENTYATDQEKSVRTTGYSRSGLNELYGSQKDSRGESSRQVTHTGSLVGSTDGSVTLTAGNDLHLTSADVMSQTATTLVGKNVTIDASVDSVSSSQFQRHSEGGITGGFGGKLVDLGMDARQSIRGAKDTDDDRLKALYAARAAYDIKDGYGIAMDTGIRGGNGPGEEGLNVQVGIGGKSASSKTTTYDETTAGSRIRSNGDVTIAATGGDLTIVGSKVEGKNVALAASHDINLLSQEEEHRLKSESKNGSGGVGVSFGTNGLGIYAEASVGKGKAHGNGTTHAETTIDATDRLTLVSGNDTTIQGAQLKGQQVVANIGNNLTIRSEQDTDDFASKTMQAGGKVMAGITQSGFVSGSAYFAQSKVDSHYSSVNEVSGIKAGAGGFQLDVGGTTHLVGGKIASDADAAKNLLSTGNLVYEDLHNESKYKASQISFSGGSTIASNVAGALGTAISAATPQHGNASSDTRSGIAEGTIVVRNDPGKDLSGLDRKPTLEDEALKNAYDAKKVADRQELTAQAGYVGMRGVGSLSQWMAENAKTDQDREAWSDGGRNKVILHGVVGAAMASLGGGNAAEGALGGASSEAVSHVMQQYLYDHNVQPGTSEWNTYMELGSAIVGGVTGRGNGANAALNGDLYNRQLHPDETNWIRGNAEKFASQQCGGCAPSPEQVEDAKARLGQQASKDVDFIWKSILPAGDDEAAQAFLANSGATYTNEVGKPQAMFTTERGQFFAPAQNMQEVDRDFIGQYVRPAVSRPLGEGVAEESKKYAELIGGAITDDPWGVGKNVAVGLAGSIKDALSHPINTGIAFKDGFVAGAQNIGEGLAAGFDDSSKRQMASIYGQDVSGVMKTVAALQTGAAIGGAIGAGKLAAAGATVAGKAVKATAKEAGELLGRAGFDDLLRGAPGDERFIFSSYLSNSSAPEVRQAFVSQAEKIRSTLPAEWQQKGNISIASIDVPGTGISSEMRAFSSFQNGENGFVSLPTGPTVLEPMSIGKGGVVNGKEAFLRNVDGEFKILENVARQLGDNVGIKGSINIYTELKSCTSCAGAIMQFREKYPGIQLNVFTGKQ